MCASIECILADILVVVLSLDMFVVLGRFLMARVFPKFVDGEVDPKLIE